LADYQALAPHSLSLSFAINLVMVIAATGVAGVVCSVNYAASGNNQLLDQIRRMGTNILIITPARAGRSLAGRAARSP
jgi:hypothetical protein